MPLLQSVLIHFLLFVVLVDACIPMNPGDYCDPCRAYYTKGGCAGIPRCSEPVYSSRTKVLSCPPNAVIYNNNVDVNFLCQCEPILTCNGKQFVTQTDFPILTNTYVTCRLPP